jgi:adenine phosphoribosyltransferase
LASTDYDILLTAEAKSIPLAQALSVETKKPYGYCANRTSLYGRSHQTETLSLPTGEPQYLFLDEKDHDLMKGKKVVIVDDVISTGSTLQGIAFWFTKAGAEVVAEAAVFYRR